MKKFLRRDWKKARKWIIIFEISLDEVKLIKIN